MIKILLLLPLAFASCIRPAIQTLPPVNVPDSAVQLDTTANLIPAPVKQKYTREELLNMGGENPRLRK